MASIKKLVAKTMGLNFTSSIKFVATSYRGQLVETWHVIPLHFRMSTFLASLLSVSHMDNTTCSQSVKPIQTFARAQPKSYIQPERDEWEWECLPLKSFMLWPNHMLSLLSFRRPALFIKALDGYLSQYCWIHPQKLPSLLFSLPLPNLFLLPSNVDSSLPLLPPTSILPFPLPSVPLFRSPSSIKPSNLSRFYFLCICVTSVLSR